MSQKTHCTRRRFLKTTGAAAAGLPFLSAKSYERVLGANDRLRMALVGCGRIGRVHLRELLGIQDEQNFEIAAVCDVYERRARRFQDQIWRSGGRPQALTRHEDVLAMNDLDYVTIAVPEHWHAQMTMEALDAGLHVYCEKPMTHTIDEAFAVVEKAQASDRKMQVGVQGMSDDSYESAYTAIKGGLLGPVTEAQIDYARNYPLERGPWRTEVDDDLPKPPDLNWERWLGPAPDHAWSAPRYYEWRNYRDYSGGVASDLFVHRITRILKACGLEVPREVVGMGGIYLWDDGRELPDTLELLAEYPPNDITPGMTVHVLGTMGNERGNAHLIRGQKATLIFTEGGWKIVEQGSDEVIATHEKEGAEDIGLHHTNLHAAIREGAELHCPPELGLYGVVAINGANQSWMQDALLTWDRNAKTWR